jgi:hypothetical protein
MIRWATRLLLAPARHLSGLALRAAGHPAGRLVALGVPPLVSGLVFGPALPSVSVGTGPVAAITVAATVLVILVQLLISGADGSGPDTRLVLPQLIPIALAATLGLAVPRLPAWAAAVLLTSLLWLTLGIAARQIRQSAQARLALREEGFSPVTLAGRTVWVVDEHRHDPTTLEGIQIWLSDKSERTPPAGA